MGIATAALMAVRLSLHGSFDVGQTRYSIPALSIPAREMFFAFILAKLVAIVAGVALTRGHPEFQHLASSFASTTSLVLFILLVMLGARQSPGQVIAATSVDYRPAGGLLRWIAIAVLAGLALRFGISGLVLGMFQVLDPEQIAAEIKDLVAVLDDPARPLDVLAYLLVLVDATNEEILYRRILQTWSCRRFGLTGGVLGVALIFGAIHASPAALVMGLWLGLLYLYSGRLWVAAVAHAVTNLAVYLLAAMQQPGTQALFFALSYAAAALTVVATIFAMRAVRRPPWHRTQTDGSGS